MVSYIPMLIMTFTVGGGGLSLMTFWNSEKLSNLEVYDVL